MIGALLGNRYELIDKIGEGGMADVYKAKCRILNRFVAIKILKNEFNEDETFIEKFRREAFAAASLTHPNIVQIFDIAKDNNANNILNYIVFEYVDGPTLKDIIRKYGKLDIPTIINYSIQICKALICAHKNGIIHRDIKPHNILVTNEGTLKVTDFGIAKASTSATVTSGEKILGTPYYLSPEQARGNSVDKRSDLYSFGIVMYEMCAGVVPFVGDNLVTVVLKHVQEAPKPPKDINNEVPDSLNNLILKSLQKKPEDRYQDANDLLSDLRRIQNSEAIFYNPDESKMSTLNSTKIMNTTTPHVINDKIEKNNKKVSGIWKVIGIWGALIIGAILLGIFIGKIWVGNMNPNFNNNNSTVDTANVEKAIIPDIENKLFDDAKILVEERGIKIEEVSSEYSNTPIKTVIRIEGNKVGDEVEKDHVVKVVTSKGVEKVVVPDVKNKDINTATAELDAKKLKYIQKLEYNEDVERNTVIKTSPEGGQTVDSGSVVTIYLSVGPPEERVTIPYLIGDNVNDAQVQLLSLGLIPKLIAEQTVDERLNLQIKSTNPPAFQEDVPIGSEIIVIYYLYTPVENTTSTPLDTTNNTVQDTTIYNTTSTPGYNTTSTPHNTTSNNTTSTTEHNTTNAHENTTIQDVTNNTQVDTTENITESQ